MDDDDNIDPRIAHTGVDVFGREVIDDSVLLADFERFLESGEANEAGADEDPETGMAQMWELLGFIDRHGRQLLHLATKGAGLPEKKN